MNQDIINYLNQYKNQFSKEQLRAKLVESGYQAYDIDNAIFDVYNQSAQQNMPESTIVNSQNNSLKIGLKGAENYYEKNEQSDLIFEYDVKFIPQKAMIESIVPSFFVALLVLFSGAVLISLGAFAIVFLISFVGNYFSYFKGKKVNYKFFRTGITVTYGPFNLKVNEHYKWDQFDKYRVSYYFLPKLVGLDLGKITFYRQDDKAVKGVFGAIGQFAQQKSQAKKEGKEDNAGFADLIGSMYQGYTQGASQDRQDQSTTVTTQVGKNGEESGSFLSRIFASFWGHSSKKYIHPSSTRTIGGSAETSINQNILYINELPGVAQVLPQIEQYLSAEKI